MAHCRIQLLLLVALMLRGTRAADKRHTKKADKCPGKIDIQNHGHVEIIPTGWGDPNAAGVDVKGSAVEPHMNARVYFAEKCNGSHYDNNDYSAINFLGKTLTYMVDLSGAGCGCNVAFYLTSMRQNPRPSECHDHYCDANNVCGESCAEIDIMEANMYAWHSTLHTQYDHGGFGAGYGGGEGWVGPRDWQKWQYGPGANCIDTWKPFKVEVSFPLNWQGQLAAMEVKLTQPGKNCPLGVRLADYGGMADLSFALQRGMTPIASFWGSDKMLWMDGLGSDGQGPCSVDLPGECPAKVRMYDFALSGQNLVTTTIVTTTTTKPRPVQKPYCPGAFDMAGFGPVYIVPAGWKMPGFAATEVRESSMLVAHREARAYFADRCTPGHYSHSDYMGLNLLQKTLSFTVDLSGAGCGCNVAFYLVSMRQNRWPSQCNDYYCDANSLCGASCGEIDIMEANQHAWHSTLKTQYDHTGYGGGYGGGDGWKGPRDWDSDEYGPGSKCIDTRHPFEVSIDFPVDNDNALAGIVLTLTQQGKHCPLSLTIKGYMGVRELSQAVSEGMTPVVRYSSSESMLWLDGKGEDGKGPCAVDDPGSCPAQVKFWNFSLSGSGVTTPAETPGTGSEVGCLHGWVPDKQCVPQFTFNQRSITGCSTFESKGRGWCSLDRVYKGRFKYCGDCDQSAAYQDEIKKEDEKIQQEISQGGDSQKLKEAEEEMAALYARCGGSGWHGPTKCEEGTACQFINEMWSQCAPYEGSERQCLNGWRVRSDCTGDFIFNDKRIVGCTEMGKPGVGWCSEDAKFIGRYRNCTPCGKWGANEAEVPAGQVVVRPIHWATHPSRCLGIYNEDKVQLWECIDSIRQKFITDLETGQIRMALTPNMCITVESKHYFTGTSLTVKPCDKDNMDQSFNLPGLHGQPISLRQDPWLCIDVSYGSTDEGTELQMFWCHPWNANQKFILGGGYGEDGHTEKIFFQKTGVVATDPELRSSLSSPGMGMLTLLGVAAIATAVAAVPVAVRWGRRARPVSAYEQLDAPIAAGSERQMP